ncbi:MAG: purine-nucleoside phosphorylase [Alphaproteobacteria bacterium]|nr:purine-nucleoside phosphorylase [Alphaproteobacteria bacterium]
MTEVQDALAAVRRHLPDFRPRLGIVLGSGFGEVAADLDEVASFSYADLPGFPAAGVAGHAGRLMLGRIEGIAVVVLQGRAHYYERGDAAAMKVPVRLVRALGAEALLLTNAAGSLRADMPPGSLMAIADHVNLVGVSPLFGEAGAERFVGMADAYDPALRELIGRAARGIGERLHEGIYVWFAGPQFETPAEIRAARLLGGDAVGMSTVPETILGCHAGLRIAGLSLITNMAAGLGTGRLSHAHTLEVAARASARAREVIRAFIKEYAK